MKEMKKTMFARRLCRRPVTRLAPLLLIAALAGCGQSSLNGEIDDFYNPPMHYQRHPISVVKDTARIELVPHRGGLRSERNEAARFAHSALAPASRSVGVRCRGGRHRRRGQVHPGWRRRAALHDRDHRL